jgi:hypothetical protein
MGGPGSFCTDRAALGDEAFTLRRQTALWACGRGLLESTDPMAKTPPTTTGKAGPDWRQASSAKQGARGRSKDDLWDEARDWRLVARQGVGVAHGRLDTLCIAGGPLSRPLSGGAPNLRGDRPAVFESIKLQAIPPLARASFSSRPACVSPLRFSFAIYSFPRVDRRPDFDGFHVLSADRP